LPTAVLAMNDFMAAGAMDALREANLRVPDDISVVGFDNRDVSEFVFPKLTTVQIDLKSIGFEAARIAAQKLSGTGEHAGERSVTIPSKMVLRDTVKQIKTAM